MFDKELTPEFLLKCRTDFVYFCEQVLDLEMTDYHREIAALPLMYRYVNIIIPRSHGKTELFSTAYPLWRLSREKDIEICLVSSSRDQSSKIFARTQYILQTNSFFESLIPNDRKFSWNQSNITTRNHNLFYTKPFNSSAKGIQPDYLLYDDILREQEFEHGNPIYVKKTFWQTFFPAGQAKKCRHVVVGTPQSIEDIYADFEKSPTWKVSRKASVIEGPDGKWLRPLWPSRFTLEELSNMRNDMGHYDFEREMQCRPTSVGDVMIKQEDILNAVDDNLELSSEVKGVASIGADFAVSTSATADYNVFIVIDDMTGQTHTKKTDKGEIVVKDPIIIRDLIRFKGLNRQTERLVELYNIYKQAKVIADNGHVGSKFVKELTEELVYVEAQGFQPQQRMALLNTMSTLFEKGRIVIPGGELSKPLTDILKRELSGMRLVKNIHTEYETWGTNLSHDDTVFSLAMAVKDVKNPKVATQDLLFVA